MLYSISYVMQQGLVLRSSSASSASSSLKLALLHKQNLSVVSRLVTTVIGRDRPFASIITTRRTISTRGGENFVNGSNRPDYRSGLVVDFHENHPRHYHHPYHHFFQAAVSTKTTTRHYSITRHNLKDQSSSQSDDSHNISRNSKKHLHSSPTFFDLVRTIPTGVKKIIKDIETYRLINDASRTKINAWTTANNTNNTNNTNTNTDNDTPGRIPRRQREHQRRLIRELQKVALPLAAALVPVVGNVFILAIAFAPRYCLSNHFLNRGHVRSFRALEYERRVDWFGRCADGFWRDFYFGGSGGGGVPPVVRLLEVVGVDAAGAIFEDATPLYNLFCKDGRRRRDDIGVDGSYHTKVPDIATMDRHHLLTLARAANLSSPILPILPRLWIQYRLASILYDITHDDLMLIEERHHHVGCVRLTEDEILDACALRGLPTEIGEGGSVGVMRECLTNYLGMVNGVLEVVGRKEFKEGVAGLFLLYLPALRYDLKLKHAR